MNAEEPADLFAQTNDDLAELLDSTSSLKKLQREALLKLRKVIAETKRLGKSLGAESQTFEKDLSILIQKPSEQCRRKVMLEALHLKNQMREL